MNVQNIDRLLLFAKAANGHTMTLEELAATYGFEPDGTNFYYGINQANVDTHQETGSALNATHTGFLDALVASTLASARDEKTLVLGLEPLQAPRPYAFVAAHLDLVHQLATDLATYQQRVRDGGKRLNIVIRYASEMNDRGQVQGGNPAGYRSTFVQAREAFTEAAPAILFSFSPALRADLAEEAIGQFWPGDAAVDIIGGTWYVGGPDQRVASTSMMRRYFLHRLGAGKPFALSEVGGHGPGNRGNDAALQIMLHDIEALQLQNVTFKYATFFLEGVWGVDAKLAFLQTDAPHMA